MIMFWDSKKVEKKFIPDFIGKANAKVPLSAADNSFEYSLTKFCFKINELKDCMLFGLCSYRSYQFKA
jgi:hypothetical protein